MNIFKRKKQDIVIFACSAAQCVETCSRDWINSAYKMEGFKILQISQSQSMTCGKNKNLHEKFTLTILYEIDG